MPMVVPKAENVPQKVVATPVESQEPSPMSMKRGDLLKMLTTASPATVDAHVAASRGFDREYQSASAALEPMRRQAEIEAEQEVKRKGPPKILSEREWIWSQPHYAHLKQKKRISVAEYNSAKAGYDAYLKRMALQAKIDLAHAKEARQYKETMAKIATEQAKARAQARSNQPGTLEALAVRRMMAGQQVGPKLGQMWEAKHSKLPGIRSKEDIAALDRGSRERIAEERREWMAGQEVLDRAHAVQIEEMRQKGKAAKKEVEKPLVTTGDMRKARLAARNISEKEGGIEEWVHEYYLPIAKGLTDEQRTQLRREVWQHLPSMTELKQIAETATQPQVRKLWPDKLPSKAEGQERINYVLAIMELHGLDEERLAAFERQYSDRLLGVQRD